MSELKAGGMALVIGCLHDAESYKIGTQVTLKEMAPHKLGDTWIIEEWLEHSRNRALAKHLMPINPEADPLETTQKESEHVR